MWFIDFLFGILILVQIRQRYSGKFEMPPGSIISQDKLCTVYAEIVEEMRVTFFCRLGGTVWKSWRNLDFIVQKLQGGYNRSRSVSYKWGFNFLLIRQRQCSL